MFSGALSACSMKQLFPTFSWLWAKGDAVWDWPPLKTDMLLLAEMCGQPRYTPKIVAGFITIMANTVAITEKNVGLLNPTYNYTKNRNNSTHIILPLYDIPLNSLFTKQPWWQTNRLFQPSYRHSHRHIGQAPRQVPFGAQPQGREAAVRRHHHGTIRATCRFLLVKTWIFGWFIDTNDIFNLKN